VWSLTRQCHISVPTAFCYYHYPLPEEHHFCAGDSNGNAAGNTLEEAMVQGFLELVERDSVALWWYNRVSRPAVALNSFHEPYFQAIQQHYRTLGRELWVLDLTSDLSIPAFVAISSQAGAGSGDKILLGFGAHVDPTIGILRALTELNQSLPWAALLDTTSITSRDPHPSEMQQWWHTATLAEQSYLLPDRSAAPKTPMDYVRDWSTDLRDDLEHCVELVAQHGMDMLVLDQTRPDVGLPVVKVIVPGLRHFWKRLGPGRLYAVPVRLGWLPQARREEEMNPIPMMF
jgi:ribosomal protein S12 methylthiotransferase accessory factor